MEIYVVQPGDTPESIAALYGVSPQRLIYDNQLSVLPYLPAGMAVLVLIPALIHTVSEGETSSTGTIPICRNSLTCAQDKAW